jgi:hypothetical protein
MVVEYSFFFLFPFLLPGKQMPMLPTHISEDDRNSQHQREQVFADAIKPLDFCLFL